MSQHKVCKVTKLAANHKEGKLYYAVLIEVIAEDSRSNQ